MHLSCGCHSSAAWHERGGHGGSYIIGIHNRVLGLKLPSHLTSLQLEKKRNQKRAVTTWYSHVDLDLASPPRSLMTWPFVPRSCPDAIPPPSFDCCALPRARTSALARRCLPPVSTHRFALLVSVPSLAPRLVSVPRSRRLSSSSSVLCLVECAWVLPTRLLAVVCPC